VSLPILDEVVTVMQNNPHITHVQVSGHTDDVGDENENLLLSQSRAESVRAYLISKGIDAKRLSAMGYGERVPVASNDNDAGRTQNRRVEFRVVKQAQTGP
jgi:outer membrane protein OmpA-like peptidoglycan-associated protein